MGLIISSYNNDFYQHYIYHSVGLMSCSLVISMYFVWLHCFTRYKGCNLETFATLFDYVIL